MLKPTFTDPAHAQDPARLFNELRRAGEVVRVKLPLIGPVWMTLSHSATSALLKDEARFSLRKGGGGAPLGLQWWMPRTIRLLANNMLTSDGDDHRRLRKLVDQAFQRRAVGRLEERTRAQAQALLYDLPADQPFDLVTNYARRLPLAVICDLLGLDDDRCRAFSAEAAKITTIAGRFDLVRAMLPIIRMRRMLDQLVRETRQTQGATANNKREHESGGPAPTGLIAELVRVETDEGRLSHDELVAMIFLLLMAGHETTTHAISTSVLSLLQDPVALRWLAEDAGRYDLAVEELLRFNSPVQFSKPRYVNQAGEFHGAPLKQGDVIMACLGAANRDPEFYEDGERMNLERRPNPHLEFGTGVHFCLGFQLARLEIRVALDVLFNRFPDLALTQDPVQWSSRLGMRALNGLIVRPTG